MANETNKSVVLLARFETGGTGEAIQQEHELLRRTLTDEDLGGEIAVYPGGVFGEEASPLAAVKQLAPEQVKILHLSGRAFSFGDSPLGAQEREAEGARLQKITDQILQFPQLQMVVLSGVDHAMLAQQLLLMGTPLVLSLQSSEHLIHQVEALYTGLIAGQSIRQTVEHMTDAYPDWDLHIQEVRYLPDQEILDWDTRKYPSGPSWQHGLLFRANQWRVLTWRLRNPLLIPVNKRRSWEQRASSILQRGERGDLLSTPFSRTEQQTPNSDNPDLTIHGRSRAVRRGAQKARELRQREEKARRRRRMLPWLLGGLGVVGLALAGLYFLAPKLKSRKVTELATRTAPCPFPEQSEAYRVLILPFAYQPDCGDDALRYSDALLESLQALKGEGVKLDVRIQAIDDCPLETDMAQTTLELCYADLMISGQYVIDTLRGYEGLEVSYLTQDLAGEKLFMTVSNLSNNFSGKSASEIDSALSESVRSLVYWARGYKHFNAEEYEPAIASFLQVNMDQGASSALVTQMLTKAYVEAGRYDQAKDFFEDLIRIHPGEPSYYFDRANMLVLMEDYSGALDDYNRVLEMAPENISALMRRGALYGKMGQDEEAVADMDAAIEREPGLPVLYNERASLFFQQKRYEEALSDYRKVLALDPEFAEAYYGQAQVYQALNRERQALIAIENALAINPNLVKASLFKGDVKADQGKWLDAEEAYSLVLLQQESAEAYNRRAQVREQLDQVEEALEDYQLARNLDPTYTPAWLGSARLYKETAQYTQALEDVNRVLGQQPTHAQALRLKTELHLAMRQWDRALETVDELSDAHPNADGIAYLRALSYLEKGELDKASSYASKAQEEAARNPYTQLLNARIYLEEEDYKAALKQLNELLRRTPGFSEGYHYRGLAYLKTGKSSRARADFERALKQQEERPETLLTLGDIYLSEGDLTRAQQTYEKAIIRFPGNMEAYIRRGALYQQTQQYDSALADYNHVVASSPNVPSQVYLERGRTKVALKQYNLALVDFNQVLRRQPEDYMTYCERGHLYQLMGNFTKAEDDLTHAQRISPTSPLPSFYLAAVYQEKGELQQALEIINESLDRDSTFALAYNRRGEIFVQMETFDGAMRDFNLSLTLDGTLAEAYDNRADLARKAREYDQALADYTRALNNQPRMADALFYRGLIYSLNREDEKAIRDIRSSLEINPEPGIRYGYLAQIYARQQAEEPFFQYLQLALEHGYPVSELTADPAFSNFRDTPRFQELLNSYSQ